MSIPKCKFVIDGHPCGEDCDIHSQTSKHIQYYQYCHAHMMHFQRLRRLNEKTECQVCGRAGTRAEIKNGRCAKCANISISWKEKSREDLEYFRQLEKNSDPIDPKSDGFQLLLKVLLSICDPEMRLHNRTGDGCKMNGIEIGI